MAKKLTTKEKLEIINSDIALWLSNFVKIPSNSGEMIPFKINAEQKDFVENKERYNIILKSRQLGFSTLSLGIMLYYAHQKPNTTYILITDKGDSMANLFERLKMMYESIPEQYRLKQRRSNRDELVFENNSRIAVMVAGSKELGRSFTAQIIHCSEFAFWGGNQQERGLVALEQALAKNDDAMIILESTANGIGNNYYNIFGNAEKGRSKYKHFFYGWTNKSHLDQFRSEIDEAVSWYRSTNKGAKLKNNPLELYPYEQKLLEKTNVTLLQLMWRQWKIQDMGEDMFKQEYPAYPMEAFISTDAGVFDANIITERMYHIPDALKKVEGIPATLERYLGHGLNIYQLPKGKDWYFGGIDVAAGLKGDDSSITILDSCGEQVATFNRNDIPVYKFVDICIALGHFYNYCMFLPERNTYGLDLINRLTKEKNYIQVLKIKKFDKIKGRRTWEYGWYSDNVSKTKMVNDLKEAFEIGTILVNDKETLEQMKIFTENKGSFGNANGKGNHDDLVDSLGLAVQSLKQGRYYI